MYRKDENKEKEAGNCPFGGSKNNLTLLENVVVLFVLLIN